MEHICKKCDILEESVDILHDELLSKENEIRILKAVVKALRGKLLDMMADKEKNAGL